MTRIGFIGFGRMGITHFAILNSHPDVDVVGIADPSRPMRAILDSHVKVPLFSDHVELLKKAKPDAVIIAPPTRFHEAAVRDAMEAGAHVFVEKPLTLSADASLGLASLARERGLVTQVGFVHRSNDVFIEAKRLLETGLIGETRTFSSEMYGATISKEPSGWRGDAKEGGGCLYEFAAHAIDLVVFMLGAPVSVGGASLDRVFSSAVEDLVSATLFLPDGQAGRLEVNWSDGAYRKPTNRITIFGTHGKIVADPYCLAVWLRDANAEEGLEAGWNRKYITDLAAPVRFYVRGNSFTNQLDNFVECVQNGDVGGTPCSFAEAAHTDVIIEKLRADAESEDRPKPRRPRPQAKRRSKRARVRAFIEKLMGALT